MPRKKRVSYLQVVQLLSVIEDLTDKSTEDHAVRVTRLVELFANKLGIKGDKLIYLSVGASIHDVGKLGISPTLFNQPSRLTKSQRFTIEQHPHLGLDIVRPIEFPTDVTDCIYDHQEHWDGSGYPRHLKGEEISLNGRVCCISDVWEAITAYRPYRKHKTREEAFRFMNDHKDWFDPKLYTLFLELYAENKL